MCLVPRKAEDFLRPIHVMVSIAIDVADCQVMLQRNDFTLGDAGRSLDPNTHRTSSVGLNLIDTPGEYLTLTFRRRN